MSDIDNLSNADIVQRCRQSKRQMIDGVFAGNRLVKLSEEVVVKFGQDVSAEEADNQRRAFELLDRSVVRVPEVYRYFTWADDAASRLEGFLVMEYVHGTVLESVESGQVDQVVKILSYFSTIQGRRPGPLQTGVSRGPLWEDNGEPVFHTVKQMESWLNFRLADVTSKLALEQYPLVLCHLDLALRNFIWLEDGSVCLVDWASAGFYPRFFEVGLLKVMEGGHEDYERILLERMEQLTTEEEAQVLLLMESYSNGIRYHFDLIHECLGDTWDVVDEQRLQLFLARLRV